jgi:hypothetical protein
MARQAAHCFSHRCLPSTASADCLTGTGGHYRLPPKKREAGPRRAQICLMDAVCGR